MASQTIQKVKLSMATQESRYFTELEVQELGKAVAGGTTVSILAIPEG